MARGTLRVYLGAAPGVGKTYRMLDEGWRRRERGTDVVVGYVETHDRPLTRAQLRDLEVVPRVAREYRGVTLEEMDLDAVRARRPAVVLVDELAHTNVPGGAHEKRWQDVEVLLDDGVDVITTVNVQHLESVNDVVERITGVVQRETVPDAVVRRADQVELVDVTPEALRRRMAHGNIYTADQVDASLANYFRVGNLSALRELALLWLADRVEDALRRYQDDHDIGETWETRERLVVGVTGTDVDEALLRRAARMASRSGAELFAVHVVAADAQRHDPAGTQLARELAGEFEGRYEEVVDDDVATALVSFARAERGTQIVVGASRPRGPWRPPSGTVERVLRHARDLDVHVIAVGGERPSRVRRRRRLGHVHPRRRALGLLGAAAALPGLTAALAAGRASLSLSTIFLCYLVVVLSASVWAGAAIGVAAALAASGLENYYFVPPLHTLEVARPDDVVALVAFLVFAAVAGTAVSRFAQRTALADRSREEAAILARAAASVAATHEDLRPLLDSVRAVYDARGVALMARRDGAMAPEVASGDSDDGFATGAEFEIDADHSLVVVGASLVAQDRALIDAFASRIAAGLRAQVVRRDSTELAAVAGAESARARLLESSAHDLLDPLEGIVARVAALRAGHPAPDDDVLLRDIGTRARRLSRLAENLVDAGRLEDGAIAPAPAPTSAAAIVADALARADRRERTVEVDVPEDLAALVVDGALASRVVANVVSNACRFSPLEQPVRVRAGTVGDRLEILVIDRGPGMAREQRGALCGPAPSPAASRAAGLNLTVASGLVRLLGGRLLFEDTPGGGLTVEVELPTGAAASPVPA